MNTPLIIDNESCEASGGDRYEVLNPLDGSLASSCAAATADDAARAAAAAQTAYLSWRSSSPSERRTLLLKAADILDEKTPDFISAMRREIGASDLWAGFNVHLASTLFREAASLATRIQGNTIPTDKPNTLSMTVRQPVGPCLSIVPWNGPVVLAARAIAYPIVCGNTVVFKASETSPETHRLLCEALYEAGLPAGVLNYITTAPSDAPNVVESLIANPQIRRINFTGSTQVGRAIAELSARHLKRCLLELGDKSPLVVLDDADIEHAVSAAIFGSFLYQGQICMSTDRIIVDESIADAFVQRFTERAASLPTGSPLQNSSCVIGPVINTAASLRINSLIDDAVDKGARVVLGGKSDSAQFPATVIDHITESMSIFEQETFGPVISILRAQDAVDAVRLANSTEFGLSAAVFGKDTKRALDVAMSIDTGSCHINGPTVQNEAQAPYGGTKASGWGRFDGGEAVIEEFTELKWITIEDSAQPYPF